MICSRQRPNNSGIGDISIDVILSILNNDDMWILSILNNDDMWYISTIQDYQSQCYFSLRYL